MSTSTYNTANAVVGKRQLREHIDFTLQQLQYLESLFPTVVHSAGSSEQIMRHYFGQQAVIQAVRERTRGIRNMDYIPAPE